MKTVKDKQLVVGADFAGFPLKEVVVEHLTKKGWTILDLGVKKDSDPNDTDLMFNQRFQKLCRLSQIGVYVDEAHHMFGAELEKSLRTNSAQTSLRSTINLLADDLTRRGTNVVGCYNYTGTPYVNNQVLPEVVYAYGLRESIINGYLKEVDVGPVEVWAGCRYFIFDMHFCYNEAV